MGLDKNRVLSMFRSILANDRPSDLEDSVESVCKSIEQGNFDEQNHQAQSSGLDRSKVADLITGHINNAMMIGTSAWNGLDALRHIKTQILDTTVYDQPTQDQPIHSDFLKIANAITETAESMGHHWDNDSFKINDWLPRWRALAKLIETSGAKAMDHWSSGAKIHREETTPVQPQGVSDEPKKFNPNARLGTAEIKFEPMGVRNGNIRYGRVRKPTNDAFDPLQQPFLVQDKQGQEWKAWMVGSGEVSPIGQDVVCHFDGQRYVFQFHGVAVGQHGHAMKIEPDAIVLGKFSDAVGYGPDHS